MPQNSIVFLLKTMEKHVSSHLLSLLPINFFQVQDGYHGILECSCASDVLEFIVVWEFIFPKLSLST